MYGCLYLAKINSTSPKYFYIKLKWIRLKMKTNVSMIIWFSKTIVLWYEWISCSLCAHETIVSMNSSAFVKWFTNTHIGETAGEGIGENRIYLWSFTKIILLEGTFSIIQCFCFSWQIKIDSFTICISLLQERSTKYSRKQGIFFFFFLVIIQHNYQGNDKSDLLLYFNLNADSTDFTQNSNMINPNCFKCPMLAV